MYKYRLAPSLTEEAESRADIAEQDQHSVRRSNLTSAMREITRATKT